MTNHILKSGVLVTWASIFTLALSGCGSSEPVASSSDSGSVSQPAPTPAATETAASSQASGEGASDPAGSGSPSESDGASPGPGYSDPAAGSGESSSEYGSEYPGSGYSDPGSEYPGSGYSDPGSEYPGSGYADPSAGYGDSYGAPGYGQGGYGQPSSGGNPLDVGAQMLTSTLAAATQIEATRFPSDYWGQAELAFKQGYEELASQLLLAHLATEPAAAGEAGHYEQVRFSRPLGKPTWFVRWGVSISVRTPDGFTGEISPITSDTRGGGTGGYEGAGYDSAMYGADVYGAEGSMGEGPAQGSDARPGGDAAAPALAEISIGEIEDNLGLFGTLTADYFEKRFAAGEFGPIFATVVPRKAAEESKPGGRGAGADMYGAQGYPGTESSPGMPADYPGYPGGGPEMYGEAYGEGPSGMYGSGGPKAPAPSVPPVAALPKPHPRWRPGIVYLGQLNYQQAIEQAKEAGIDFLIHFDVKVDERARTEDVVNETRARVVNVHSPEKPVALSRKLSNMDVKNRIRVQESARQRGGNPSGTAEAAPADDKDIPKEMVSEALAPMFDSIDRDLKLIEMPALNETQVRSRVGSLIAGGSESPLAALAEFQLYRSRGQLSEDDMVAATELLLGDDGLRLLVGSEPVRREVMTSLQPPISSYGELGMDPPQPEQPAAPASQRR